jgi:hemolysin activation/secretion protein
MEGFVLSLSISARRFFSLVCAIFCYHLSLPTNAADSISSSSSDNSTEFRLRDKAAQERLDKKLDNTSPPIQLPEVQPIAEQPKATVCFFIKEIKVEGLLSEWAHANGKDYIGQCIGYDTITAYVRLIDQKLLSEGYVTSRAILPEQNISSGLLMIQIQAGIIEKIVFPENYAFIWENALPMSPGQVLNLRDMEQAVDQLNRLPSQRVEFKIKPGSYSGASILVAEVVSKKPWTVNASIDDSGGKQTGDYPISYGASLDNALGVQDSLSFSGSRAREAETGASNSTSFGWSLPMGYWLLDVNSSHFDYRQQVIGDVQSFELSGVGRDQKLSLNRVVFRDNKTKIGLFGSVKTRERRSFSNDVEIQNNSRNLTEAELGASYRRYFTSAVLDLSLSAHQGIDLLGADEVDPNADPSTAQPDYRFYTMVASISAPFSLLETPLNYSGRFFMQYADTPIYSLDWFSIGGRYTVRGFSNVESLSAVNGWRLRNDLALPFELNGSSNASYLGLDIGQVEGEGAEDASSKTLMGISVGLKGHLLGVDYDVSLSEPFLAHGPYAKPHDSKVSMMLSAQF